MKVLACILTLAAAASASDWPQWRGAQRDGVWREQGVIDHIPAEGLKILWRAPVGNSWASPVVAAGRVYVRDAVLAKPKAVERLHCLDEASGKELWLQSREVQYPDWAFAPDQASGPTSTPCVHDGKIYTLGEHGDVLCLDAATGSVLWHRDMAADYQMKEFMGNVSPLVDGRLLILCIGGKPEAGVVALDKDSGKEAWHALDEEQSNSSPIVIEAGGKRQLIVWTQQSVSSLDPASGKTWWRQRLLTAQDSAVATPVVDGSLLLVGGMMFKLDSEKPAATILWPENHSLSHRILSNTSTAILQAGHVCGVRSKGEFVCLEALTGKELWTTDKVTAPRSGFGAAVHVAPNDGGAFLYNDEGVLFRAKLTPQGYEEAGRALLLAPVYKFGGHKVNWSPPAYADGRVFARNEKEVVCADLHAAAR